MFELNMIYQISDSNKKDQGVIAAKTLIIFSDMFTITIIEIDLFKDP